MPAFNNLRESVYSLLDSRLGNAAKVAKVKRAGLPSHAVLPLEVMDGQGGYLRTQYQPGVNDRGIRTANVVEVPSMAPDYLQSHIATKLEGMSDDAVRQQYALLPQHNATTKYSPNYPDAELAGTTTEITPKDFDLDIIPTEIMRQELLPQFYNEAVINYPIRRANRMLQGTGFSERFDATGVMQDRVPAMKPFVAQAVIDSTPSQTVFEPVPSPWDDTPTAVVTTPPTSPETAVLAAKVDNSNELLETSKQQLAGAKPPSKAVTQQDLEPTKGVTKTVTRTPEEQGKEWLSLTPEQRSWAKLDYAGIDYSSMDSEQLIQAANGVNEQFYKAFPHFRVAEWQEQGKTITPLNPKGTTQQPSSQGKPPTIEYSPIGTTERVVRKTPKPAPPILPERGLALSSEAQNRQGYSKSYDVPQYEPTQASKAVAQPVATDSKGIPLWQLGLGGTGILGVGYLGAQAIIAQQEKDRQQLGLQSAYGQMPNYY